MIIKAVQCDRCGAASLLSDIAFEKWEAERLRGEHETCAITLSSGPFITRCDGTWLPFAQWSAELSR